MRYKRYISVLIYLLICTYWVETVNILHKNSSAAPKSRSDGPTRPALEEQMGINQSRLNTNNGDIGQQPNRLCVVNSSATDSAERFFYTYSGLRIYFTNTEIKAYRNLKW